MTIFCPSCGAELQVGDWPYCPHGSTRPDRAQRFDPIVVDRDPMTGKISYPMSATDPTPAGYVREHLDTIQKIDDFCRARSDEETTKRRSFIRAEKEYWDTRIKERREFVREEMRRRGFKGKAFDRITRFVDRQREARYARQLNQEVHFFSDVFAYDSSNRESHSSERTDCRQRKG